MNSTIKISTGFTVLTTGIAFILFSMYTGALNFSLYGGLNLATITLFLILTSAGFLLAKPNAVNTTLFGVATGAFMYLMQQNKIMDNSSAFIIPMLVCFLGLFLIVNGIYSSGK